MPDPPDDDLDLFAVQHLLLQHDPAPATALDADIEAGSPLEPHLVGIDTCIEQFVGGKNHRRGCVQGIDADPLGAVFCQQVARPVKIEFISDPVPTVATV